MKLALVGTAYEAKEAKEGKAFTGSSSKMLDTLLRSAGIDRDDCLLTNVFNREPIDDDYLNFFGPKKAGVPGLPPIKNSKYLLPEYAGELDRLRGEIVDNKIGVIVPLGPVALWALTGYANVGTRRGAWHEAERCMPTYHPKTIMAQYTWFPLAVSDLWKAKGLADGALSPAKFDLIPRPTFSEVEEFCNPANVRSGPITFDIETSPKFRAITCVGVGHSGRFMCVPLADEGSKGFSYWPDVRTECQVWGALRRLLELPGVPKIAHHSTYDLTWLYTVAGIRVAGPVFDTRIMHHTLLPELPHTLGSIGHTYFILPPWKAMRKASKEENQD